MTLPVYYSLLTDAEERNDVSHHAITLGDYDFTGIFICLQIQEIAVSHHVMTLMMGTTSHVTRATATSCVRGE